MITTLLLLSMVITSAEAVPVSEDTQDTVIVRKDWKMAIQAVFEQLDMLDMFALATKMAGVTVKVPKELQSVPIRMIESADGLRAKNIEILVKELVFKELNFAYNKTPQWSEERPLVPTLVEFGTLGVMAEAKTKMGVIPLGATFQNGRLPVDFLPLIEKGYELKVLPENRAEDALLDDVQLKVGGGLATRIANRLFGKKATQLILEYGVGQTLQMGQDELITVDAASRLFDIPQDSRRGKVLEKVIEGIAH